MARRRAVCPLGVATDVPIRTPGDRKEERRKKRKESKEIVSDRFSALAAGVLQQGPPWLTHGDRARVVAVRCTPCLSIQAPSVALPAAEPPNIPVATPPGAEHRMDDLNIQTPNSLNTD